MRTLEEERNPYFQQVIDDSGNFFNKYLPDGIAKKGRNCMQNFLTFQILILYLQFLFHSKYYT